VYPLGANVPFVQTTEQAEIAVPFGSIAGVPTIKISVPSTLLSQQSLLSHVKPAQASIGSGLLRKEPALHEWSAVQTGLLGVQQSLLLQVDPAQTSVGSGSWREESALHELCPKEEDVQVGFGSQHSELVQVLAAQMSVGNGDFTVLSASHELCPKAGEAQVGVGSQHAACWAESVFVAHGLFTQFMVSGELLMVDPAAQTKSVPTLLPRRRTRNP